MSITKSVSKAPSSGALCPTTDQNFGEREPDLLIFGHWLVYTWRRRSGFIYHLDTSKSSKSYERKNPPKCLDGKMTFTGKKSLAQMKPSYGPAVTYYFTLLRDELAKDPDEIGCRLFSRLLDLIMECFEIQPNKRPKAGNLCERLDELRKEAEIKGQNFEQEVLTPGGSSTRSVRSNHVSDNEDFLAKSPSQRNLTFPEDPPSHHYR